MRTWQQALHAPSILALICAIGLGVTYLDGRFTPAATQDTPAAATTAAPAATPAKATFVGSETCMGCHDESIQTQLQGNFHGRAMAALEAKGKGHLCEGCHGAGSVHAEDGTAETAKPLVAASQNGNGCQQCHSTRVSTAKWRMGDHLKAGVGCAQCHSMTDPKSTPVGAPAGTAKKVTAPKVAPHAILQPAPSSETCQSCHGNTRGEFALPSHHPVKEGKVSCADCHDPHGPLDDNAKRDTCVKCHAKQRGPFVYEHNKADGLTEECLDCHRPHGSPNARLLKLTNRGLCLQCHGDMVGHFPGRNCQSCHRAVHGSNTNPLLFTR